MFAANCYFFVELKITERAEVTQRRKAEVLSGKKIDRELTMNFS